MIKLLTKTHVLVVVTFAALGTLVLAAGWIWPGIELHALTFFVVVASIFVILLIVDLRTNVLLQKLINRTQLQEELNKSFSQYEALLRLRDLTTDTPDLPPSRHWAASPDFLVHLYQQIEKCRPKIIVELGSGLSTLVGAYALRNLDYGGVIHSIDQSGAYLEKTRIEIKRHGLESFVRFHEAPLEELDIAGTRFTWYNKQFIHELGAVDCLIVDGPPLSVGQNARYPALPLLISKFSSEAFVLVDDAAREDEKEVIQRWLEEFPDLVKSDLPSEKGCVLLQKI